MEPPLFWSVRVGLADYWARQRDSRGDGASRRLNTGAGAVSFPAGYAAGGRRPSQIGRRLTRRIEAQPGGCGLPDRTWPAGGGRRRLPHRGALPRTRGQESKLYLPRWTLANYYYRRNDTARFWLWANRAAEMLYDDPAPLFGLCERVAEDRDMAEHLNLRRADLRESYLSYLIGRREINRIGRTLAVCSAAARPSDVPLLLASCDLLLEGKQVDDALRIWNGLAAGTASGSHPWRRTAGRF